MIRRIAATALIASLALITGAEGAKAPDVTKLFDQALETVRADDDFAKATVLEADGSPAHKGVVTSAAEIVRWRFVLNNQRTEDSSFLSATVNYRRGEFARVVGDTEPYLGNLEIKKAPTLTLDKAVSLLESAGYDDGFTGVTLRAPVGPEKTAPLYIFNTGDRFVGVNTKTGKVKPLT